jgi:hypothetical protein
VTWRDDERAAVLRAFASDDPSVVSEAATLLTFKAREMRARGLDPAELVVVRIARDEAIGIARRSVQT